MTAAPKKRGDTATSAAPRTLAASPKTAATKVSTKGRPGANLPALVYSVGASKHDATPGQRTARSFADFAAYCLQEDGRSTEKGRRYVCAPLDTNAANAKGHWRVAAAVLPRRWFALDVDGCPASESAALTKWAKQFRGFVYTTASDTTTVRRVRFVWELADDVDRAQGIAHGEWVRQEVARVAPRAKVDDCTFRGEQPVYLPLADADSKAWLDAPSMSVQHAADALPRMPDGGGTASRGALDLVSLNAVPVARMTPEQALHVLNGLPPHWGAAGEGTWYKVAAALHMQFSGSEEAYRVLDEWSSERDGYDEAANRARWEAGFSHERGRDDLITMHGLVKAARAYQCEIPPDWLAAWGYTTVNDVQPDERGNAEWLVERHPQKFVNLKLSPDADKCRLRYFNGRVWDWGDDCRELKRDMDQLIAYWRNRAKEAARREEKKLADALNAWATKCRTKAVIEGTHWQLTRHMGIERQLDDFDNRPGLLCVENGTLDLDTGRLIAHDPDHLLTTYIPIAYDPAAQAPQWRRLIDFASNGDAELADYIQRALGYCISGHTSEQVLLALIGNSNSGKSTITETMCAVLGRAHTISLSHVAVRAGGYAESKGYEHARLLGKRIAIIPEVNRDEPLDVEMLKRLSGEERISARQIRKEPVEFLPRAKLLLVGNSFPVVDAGNEPFWRRAFIIPFDRVVPPEDRDKNLREKLRREAPGILAWLVVGYTKWKARGLQDRPEAVRLAGQLYRAAKDPHETWYGECCETRGETRASLLYADYFGWFGSHRARFGLNEEALPMNQTQFGLWLDRKGHEVVKRREGRSRTSISLRLP